MNSRAEKNAYGLWSDAKPEKFQMPPWGVGMALRIIETVFWRMAGDQVN